MGAAVHPRDTSAQVQSGYLNRVRLSAVAAAASASFVCVSLWLE